MNPTDQTDPNAGQPAQDVPAIPEAPVTETPEAPVSEPTPAPEPEPQPSAPYGAPDQSQDQGNSGGIPPAA